MLKQNLKAILKNKKSVLVIALFLFAFVSLSVILYFYKNKKPEFQVPKVEYAQAYSLTNDKISQSAGVAVYLPSNVKLSKNEAQNNTKFTPEIKGVWIESDKDDVVIFKPDEQLKIGRYYTAVLKMDDKTIENDFLIVDDPKVLTVFPKVDSEASEDSKITVMFNRPMVPITTLDVLEKFEMPIEVYPPTEGKYKWIGTATAQFIPEERLTRSSNYTVKIKPEFVSMDGLSITGYEHKFTTRKLRYEYLSSKTTVYNRPIRVKFNQPVDLRKTSSEIELTNITSNNRVEFIAEYGNKSVYNNEENKYEKSEDKSAVLIYNKKDKHNREKLWDFENNYNLKINKAYPLEGDIFIDLSKETNIQVTGIIKSTSATSERTNFATPDFFDPEGKLWISFYEDIDLAKSKISADKLVKIDYGEKCKENNNLSSANCEKEANKSKIYLEFDYSKINNSDILKVNLEKIINTENLKINNLPLVKNITVIPDFKILRTIPDNNANSASLSEFVICSNSPLTVPADEDIEKYLKMNLEFEFKDWRKTRRIPNDYIRSHYECQPGEFETKISYGLMPESWYNLEIEVSDHFGRENTIKRNFKTGKMPEHYLNFYNFQKRYNVTTPEKTKLTYAVENMDYINLQICELDPEDMLDYLERGLSYTNPVVKNCQQVIKDKINLPKKYWIKNYFTVDLKDYLEDPLGHYILTFSHPDYKERYGKNRKQVYERTSLTITNLGVVEKKVEMRDQYYGHSQTTVLTSEQQEKLKNIYWVTTFKDTEAVKGAKIQLFESVKTKNSSSSWLKGSAPYYTNNSGIAETSIENNLVGVIVSKGNDSAIISNKTNKLQYGSTARSAQKIYTYTDRPIYRPGHEVYLKGLYRIGYDGDYEIFREEKVLVKVYDSRNKEIFNQELEVSEFGTFDTKLILDTKASLGRYRIDAKGATTYFDVQEYVPAPFKVETKTDQEEYISGDTLNLNLDADYYFGAPVEGGEVEYAIASQNYYFDKYKGEYFNFGSSWYYCYDCNYGDKFISRNKTEIDEHGKAKISFKLDLEKLFKDDENSKSKIFVVYMTVKNSSGQSISAQKSFIVHRGEYYLGLKTDKYFLGKNESFKAKVKSVNTEGKEVAVNNINLKINKVQWVQNKRKEVDGGYYYKWEKKLELIKEKKINTDRNGNWSGDFSLDQEGSYEIVLISKDSRGNIITNSRSIYVYGEAQVDVRRTNDEELEIVVEKSSLQVGDQAEIIIKSPYKKARALVSVERGRIFDYKIIDLDQSLYKYSVNVPLEYIPNFYISVVLLSPDPEIKYGQVGFQVDTGKKELNISIKTDKEFYLPGEEVKLKIQSNDSSNNPTKTELSVAVADLSVLALKGNPKKNPLKFFYGGFPLTVSTASNLKNILYEVDIANETKGGGGADAEDLAKKKRGIFKDTAFWQAIIETDENGKAELNFTLPDNLTTWQIETVGISKDTKLGVGYNEIIARKDIMVTPLKPRFAIPGDEFYIGAKIFNQTNKKQDLEVSFLSETLTLKNDSNKKNIQINANESKTIYFNVIAGQSYQNGAHKFILSAKNNEYEDTVENSIKITRNDTYEATATAGYSNEKIINEFVYLPENIIKDKGNLTIKHSATLAVFLSDALNYLVSYPYGCSEQVASKLNSIAIVKKGLNIENVGDKFKLEDIEFDGRSYTMDELVEIGLIRIYENQKSNGGFSYYPDGQSNIYPSLHIVKTLKNLKDAGYEIDEDRLRRAFAYINNKVSHDRYLKDNKNLVILAVNSLSEIKEYGKINNNLINYLKKIRNDKLFLNERINNTSLAILAITLADNEDIYGAEYKNEVFNILENRIEIDSRGAFLLSGQNTYWQYYATPTKDTALLLKALTRDERDNKILDKVLRWLLRSRSKDGAWGSTNNTVTVIDSMVEYLIWQRETESEFNLKILYDGEEKQFFDYNAESILSQNELKMPISELKFGTLSNLTFEKTNQNELKNNFYYDASLKYFLPIDTIPPRDEGFAITREFYKLDDKENENPISKAKVGDVLRGHIKIFLPSQRNFVAIEDFIPAGAELVNFNLATESSALLKDKKSNEYNWWRNYRYNRYLRPDIKEMRDDRMFIFNERLPEGEYEFDYYIRVLIPGKFHHLPAVVSEMYFPENFGRTSGRYFEVE